MYLLVPPNVTRRTVKLSTSTSNGILALIPTPTIAPTHRALRTTSVRFGELQFLLIKQRTQGSGVIASRLSLLDLMVRSTYVATKEDKLSITTSGYNKASPPPPVDEFTGPTELGGAINAPLDAQGHNTYMGDKFYPFSQSQGFTPSTCASACLAQTQYDAAHPAADGSYMSCVSTLSPMIQCTH